MTKIVDAGKAGPRDVIKHMLQNGSVLWELCFSNV